MKMFLRIAASGIACLVALASSAPIGRPAEAQSGSNTLTIATPAEPAHFDSRGDGLAEGIEVQYQVFDGLLEVDVTSGKIAPALAESWSLSPDGKRYEFVLRKGVRFHNGTEFTSADVKYTFEFLTGARPGFPYAAQFKPFLKSVETPDPYRVVMTLNQPWSDFESLLAKLWACRIVSQQAIEAAGKDYGVSKVVGTGPFMLKEWLKGDHVTVVRNPNYWRKGLPNLDAITYRRVPDATTRLIQVKTGQVDLIFSPPLDQIQQATGDPNLTVHTAQGNPVVFVRLNTATAPFSDKRVRQALYYGLDRAQLTKAIYGELAVEFKDMFPSWHWAHDPNYPGVPVDRGKAKRLLGEVGFGPNNPLAFDLLTVAESEFSQLAVLIQAQLAEIGVSARVRQMTQAALTELQLGPNREQYKASVERLLLPTGTADDYIYKQFGAEGSINRIFLNEAGKLRLPDVEQQIQRARTAKDQKEARDLYRALVERLTDEAAIIRIANKKSVEISTKRVQNLNLQGTDLYSKRDVSLQK